MPEGGMKVASFTVNAKGEVENLTPEDCIITNEKLTRIDFVKKGVPDENGNLPPLADAQFELYKQRDPFPGEKEGDYIPVLVSTKVGTEVSRVVSSDEQGAFGYDKLSPGKYAIKEVVAPEGYIAPKDFIVKFEVKADAKGNLTIENVTDIDDEAIPREGTAGAYYYTVLNRKPLFPSTGGLGTLAFSLGGAALMGGAYVHSWRQRREEAHRKKKRGEDDED